MDEIVRSSALEIGEGIHRGEYTSEEVTQAFLNRIPRLQATLGAFALYAPGNAIRAARAADARRARSEPDTLPLLHGVPSAIKDLVMTRGTRTQFGSRAFRYFIPPFSAPMVKRFKASGLVSCGKLATAELGVLPVTENDVGPPARNPWDPNRSSGGSSGGSSAAVASGMLPIVHASDGGGSIRIPAAFCYRFGFKPSLQLLGNLHGKVNKLGLSVMGPISLTVEDAAAFLDALMPTPPEGRLPGPCLLASRQKSRRLKIRMVLNGTISPLDPEFSAATRKMGELLASAGHEVEEISAFETSVEEFLPVWQYMVSRVPVLLPHKLQPITRWIHGAGKKVTYQHAKSIQDSYTTRLDKMIGDADVLLTPTVPGPAPRIDEFPQSNPEESFMQLARFGSLTALFNLTNGPAASIPFGFTGEGFPIGVQVGARPGQDGMLLSLCKEIEGMAPWRDHWPTIANFES